MSTRPQASGLGAGIRKGCQVLGSALVTGTLLVTLSALVQAQAPRTVQDGVFTDAQAARGQASSVGRRQHGRGAGGRARHDPAP